MAEFLSEKLSIPVISKDKIKELLFDDVGFDSREKKVKLGIASMNIMYYIAENLMKCEKPFILENNFENVSKAGLAELFLKASEELLEATIRGDGEAVAKGLDELMVWN